MVDIIGNHTELQHDDSWKLESGFTSVINRNTTYYFLCVTARACDEAFFSFKNVESLFVDFEPVVTMENKQPLTAFAYVFLLTSSAECFCPQQACSQAIFTHWVGGAR